MHLSFYFLKKYSSENVAQKYNIAPKINGTYYQYNSEKRASMSQC